MQAGPYRVDAGRIQGPVHARSPSGDDDRQIEIAIGRQQWSRIGEVRLGEHQHRIEIAGVGGDQTSVDEAGPGQGIGQRGDDDELVGIGHDDAFGQVGVVGGPPQHAAPFVDPDDPGQASVSPEMSPTTSTRSPTAMARRPSSLARIAVTDLARLVPASTRQVYRPRSTVITIADGRIIVCRTGFGARPGAAAGTDVDVVVVPVVAQGLQDDAPVASSMPVHIAANPGSVLAVLSMSSTTDRAPPARRWRRRWPSGGRPRPARFRR